MGYVYSLYLHLKQNSVGVNIGDNVTLGQSIAQGDDTGNSSANHLHFQLIVHNLADRRLFVNAIDSENRTRNPELWLKPLAGTARLAGKVTDNGGTPIYNLTITGLQKSVGAITLRTYSDPAIKSDDILVENFATTDITPGTYCVQAKTGTIVYKDFGCRNFAANQTTYMGLYPVYLPEVKGPNPVSSITVRNNSGTDTAQVNTTYFLANGTVVNQRTDTLSPNGSLTFAPTGIVPDSAIVVGSQDVSVAVSKQRTASPYSGGAYAGIPAAKTSSTFYVPLVGRLLPAAGGLVSNSELAIQNAGTAPVDVTLQMIGAVNVWGNYTKPIVTIPANGSFTYDLSLENAANLPNGWYGSAVVSASGNGKLAVTSNFRTGNNIVQTFNAFSAESLSTVWRVPLFTARLTNGLSTPISLQNLSGAAIPVNGITLNCTVDPGSSGTSFMKQNTAAIAVNGAYYFNPVTDMSFQGNWYGSCTVTSGNANVVSFVQMRYVGAGNTDNAAAYESIRGNGTDKRAIFPLYQKVLNNGSATAVTIQNLNPTASANVTFVYTGAPGTAANCSATIAATIPANGSLIHNHRITSGANSVSQLGTNCAGSLFVTSDQAIDGFIQLTNINNPTGDTFMAHNALTLP